MSNINEHLYKSCSSLHIAYHRFNTKQNVLKIVMVTGKKYWNYEDKKSPS